MARRRVALRVLVHYHDVVAVDRVLQAGRAVVLGEGGDIDLPPPGDQLELARVDWTGPGAARAWLADGRCVQLQEGAPARLVAGPLTVELSLVPQHRLPRAPLGEGDGLMLATLAVMVLLGSLLRVLSAHVEPPQVQVLEPTPELIARLIQQEFDGAEQAPAQEHVPEVATDREVPSFYLPAGNKGPLDRAGGGEEVASQARRTDPNPRPERARHQPLAPQPDAVPTPDGPPAQPVLGVQEPRRIADADQGAEEDVAPRPDPAEVRRGWGFRDWMDADDARRAEDALARRLELVRKRLAIDPDDPWALSNLGYYYYLAEQFDQGRRIYERFIELFPEEPAGYNNLALVYKRMGRYVEEERFYRKALALDPNDEHVLNNLAVNLAHQGRFDEALAIMARLEALDPDDPYADLHRAKIYAAMGQDGLALEYLDRALAGVQQLDTLHHIEFRQDLRVDPAFGRLRRTPAFASLLERYYGDDARPLLGVHRG